MSLTRHVFGSPWSFGFCRRLCAVLSLALMIGAAPAIATAANVAVIDSSPTRPLFGQTWCDLLVANGNDCTLFPPSGPTGSWDPFDVVIDLSIVWTDPGNLLARRMEKGKSVITWGGAPLALGIRTNATVQSWIGANDISLGLDFIVTVNADPIILGIPVGVAIGYCGESGCSALRDTAGHDNVKIVAEFSFPNPPFPPHFAILRNTWNRGRSVYLSDGFFPVSESTNDSFILNAVRDLSRSIPATSTWGVVALTLLLASAGTVLVRRLSSHLRRMTAGVINQ